ncbi:MAG TPA: NlpC/P60 family protein [Angustibacter sp.]|nr:NlpC/P60 family protein [Angustibacter sp.]
MSARSPRRLAGRWAAAAVAAALAGATLQLAPASADPGVAQLRREAADLRRQLDQLTVEQDLAVERYDAAREALLQATTGEVAASTAVLDSERAVQDSEDVAARRVRAIYLSGGPIGLTGTVLRSTSLDDALVRWHAVETIIATDVDRTAASQAAATRQRQAALGAGRLRARAVALQLAADRAATAVTTAISRQRDLIVRADARVVELVDQQRREAEARALAQAAETARALGLGGVLGAGGRGLEGPSSGSTTLPDVPAPNAVAAAAIKAAATRLGLPYVWGATGPSSFDCSGLTQWAYAQAGVRLPRTSREQYAQLPKVPLDQLAPGDLVFYAVDVADPATIHHVGIYLGDGLSLYAPQTGSVVKIGAVGYGRIIGAARPSLLGGA